MTSKNNDKIVSYAHRHTVKKFELIESYIQGWAQKLIHIDSCEKLLFIDCMCNSGVYIDENGEETFGTPIRVANILENVAIENPDKKIQLIFNDYNKDKVEKLKTNLPQNSTNFCVITSSMDANALLRQLSRKLRNSKGLHFFLLYDPYDASINWDCLRPFFLSWGEVLINHMISDSIRAIAQVKKEDKKNKYEQTYQADIEELYAYGTDKTKYEKRVIDIINSLKGPENRDYYIAFFPFFNQKNALVYDLIHCTGHPAGFELFKTTAWKIFGGKSSLKHKNNTQIQFDFNNEKCQLRNSFDSDCYDVKDMAIYIQNHYRGQVNVRLDEIKSLLKKHPVFPCDGFMKELKKILKSTYFAKEKKECGHNVITFTDMEG